MAPTSTRQSKATTKKSAQSPESQIDSYQASSSAGMTDSQGAESINNLIEERLQANKNKRTKRTQQIHAQYTFKVQKSKKRIDSTFARAQKDRTALRASQTAKLASLLERKIAVEAKMVDCIRKLDEAYKNGTRELQSVARVRREELEKAMAGVKKT